LFKQRGRNAEDGTKIDMTWDQFFEVAKKVQGRRASLRPALGYSTGDPPNFLLRLHGGRTAPWKSPRTASAVEFNKPEFVEGMQKFSRAWRTG